MNAVERAREGRPWIWPLVTMVAALLPVLGVFSASRIFHVRDLALFFWPRYLWLRNTLAAGERLVIIDLPQMVDLVGNPRGMDFLLRDCANMAGWFRSRGLDVDEHDLFGELMAHVF